MVGALLLLFSWSQASADTNAVNPIVPPLVGYVNGAVGFSFTPSTNLAVTRVGYLHYDASSPVITIWSDTNFIIASFPMTPGSATNGTMVWTNVNLTLFAGSRYSIMLQVSPYPVFPQAYLMSTDFQVAPQLTNFATRIFLPGSIVDYGTNGLLLGPNFSYTNQTTPVVLPRMRIAADHRTNALVSWPAAPAGFVLQQKPSLSVSNWMLITNVLHLPNGTNEVLFSPASGNSFFRLIHP